MPDFVGYCPLEVTDDALGLVFPMAVFYPATTPEKPESREGYPLSVALDGPPKAGPFPLVLLSHGTGSSPWVYRTLAHYLAAHGFVVGLPEHPFNNRNNNTWQGTLQNLTARPRHLQLSIDSLVDHPKFAALLKPGTVGLIGHSMGGYTALALAGGRPTVPAPALPGSPTPVFLTPVDNRVTALVLLAPATPWFAEPEALRNVAVPILLLEAEKDEHTAPWHGQIVLNGVADKRKVDHRIEENAGHFSFLSLFPPARVSPDFPPSQDPPGFNRAGFHEKMNAEVAAFLARHL